MKRPLREGLQERRRFGHQRLHVLLCREGWTVNHKRVYRIYREEGFAVRRRCRKRVARERCPRLGRRNPSSAGRWTS